jgi:hypothetical protein
LEVLLQTKMEIDLTLAVYGIGYCPKIKTIGNKNQIFFLTDLPPFTFCIFSFLQLILQVFVKIRNKQKFF